MLVPRSRTVDPELLKESLFKLTDLETRFGLNLNVLDATRTPMVMGLKEVLSNWVASQIDIVQRRSLHRLEQDRCAGWSWSRAISSPSSISTG